MSKRPAVPDDFTFGSKALVPFICLLERDQIETNVFLAGGTRLTGLIGGFDVDPIPCFVLTRGFSSQLVFIGQVASICPVHPFLFKPEKT